MSKGKKPRPSVKVPKYGLSGKGSGFAQTARRLAQKQPSFKESVTAHWPITRKGASLRRKFNGAQVRYRSHGIYVRKDGIGRGAFPKPVKPDRKDRWRYGKRVCQHK